MVRFLWDKRVKQTWKVVLSKETGVDKAKKVWSSYKESRKENGKKPKLHDYEFYLQYPIEETTPNKAIKNIMGVDIGLAKLFAAAIFGPGDKKPFFVRIVKDEAFGLRIRRRKQLYHLRKKHSKRQKQKRMRDIRNVINQFYHTKIKEIVLWAEQNNAAIALENIQDLKKAESKGKKRSQV